MLKNQKYSIFIKKNHMTWLTTDIKGRKNLPAELFSHYNWTS